MIQIFINIVISTSLSRIEINESVQVQICTDCIFNNTIKNMIKWYFESNYDEEDFNKFYLKIKDYKLTGAIMAQFLLSMVLDEKYALLDNYKLLHSIVKENNYEEDVIKENMYT